MRLSIAISWILIMHTAAWSATLEVPKNHNTIQAAIKAAAHGDTVLVASGVYFENIDFLGKAITVTSSGGAEQTMINGNQWNHVVTFQRGEGLDSMIQGFTLYNGAGGANAAGGGVICIGASPTIRNNIIRANKAEVGGGGISCSQGAPLISNNVIENNYLWGAITHGGGILLLQSNAIVEDNILRNNNCTWAGGIAVFYESPMIRNNRISENWGVGVGLENSNGMVLQNEIHDNHGSGVSCSGGSPYLVNNRIFGNTGTYVMCGGGIYCNLDTQATLLNNTVYNNSTPNGGGGFGCIQDCHVEIVNTIFYGNQGPEIYLKDYYGSSTVDIRYSAVEGGLSSVQVDPGCTLNWGAGMVVSDPLLVNVFRNDFHIFHHSPCKDMGDPSVAGLPMYDFEGDPRVSGGRVDMGADEFHTHLYYTGNTSPGSNISLNFIDNPNTAPVVLWLGSGVLSNPMPLPPYGDWYLQFPILMQAQLGSIPGPDGVLSLPCTIPGNLPPVDLPLQAGIGLKLTNLLELKIK